MWSTYMTGTTSKKSVKLQTKLLISSFVFSFYLPLYILIKEGNDRV